MLFKFGYTMGKQIITRARLPLTKNTPGDNDYSKKIMF